MKELRGPTRLYVSIIRMTLNAYSSYRPAVFVSPVDGLVTHRSSFHSTSYSTKSRIEPLSFAPYDFRSLRKPKKAWLALSNPVSVLWSSFSATLFMASDLLFVLALSSSSLANLSTASISLFILALSSSFILEQPRSSSIAAIDSSSSFLISFRSFSASTVSLKTTSCFKYGADPAIAIEELKPSFGIRTPLSSLDL